MRKRYRKWVGIWGKSNDITFLLFLLTTAFLMVCSIIWVYHIRVLNGPKVYSDGFGYFVYLPALIYGDFDFGFVEGWEHPLKLIEAAGGYVNKYPVGVAVMESPFFCGPFGFSFKRCSDREYDGNRI